MGGTPAPHVHIIGAGLAGLGAAVRLRNTGIRLSLYEAAPRAGGRCRSFHDPQIGRVIDNGNHLLLSGNQAVMAYLDEIGACDRITGPAAAAFAFVDVGANARWTLRPNRGSLPWWVLDATRRVPGTHAVSYLSALRVLHASPTETVADCAASSTTLFRNFWEPLAVAALNESAQNGAAALLSPVLRETFLRGADACRPLAARESLAHALVDPAVDLLRSAGAEIRFSCRVRAISFSQGRVTGLATDAGDVPLAAKDTLIVAVPPWVAETLLPELKVPPAGQAIVNVHYVLPKAVTARGDVRVVGVIGGLAQWVFLRGDMASVTISAADEIADEAAETISARCWHDVARVLESPDLPEPPARVVKEKRATFAQTPAALKLRPDAATAAANLLLAGDWTATGLPATIEGAVRSGFRAADLARTLFHRATDRADRQGRVRA